VGAEVQEVQKVLAEADGPVGLGTGSKAVQTEQAEEEEQLNSQDFHLMDIECVGSEESPES
jgi:hypothetical protein